GKVKKSKSISVEVKQLVEGIAISGQSVIQPSAKAKTTVKYKAECTPTTANNKKVSWSFSSDSVVLTKTINGSEMTLKETSGNLTLPKGMTIPSDESERTFTLYVRSADGNCMSSVDVTLGNKAEILPTVTVSENTLTDYQLFVENKKSRIEYKTNKNGNSTLSYATVSVVDLQETEGNENTLTLSANMNGTWTSSNANVVGVSAAVNEITDNVTVYGLKTGKAKVTFRSSDGSGKKTTFTVYVKTPVSGVAMGINIDYSLRTLAVGKSVMPPVYVEKAYGKPSNSSLTWSYEFRPVEYSVDSSTAQLNFTLGESNDECMALYTATLLDKSVTVNKTTGALKINKSKWNEYHSDYTDKVFVRVRATAADGTGFYDGINYMVTTPVTGVSVNRVENGSFVSMKKNEKMEIGEQGIGYYLYIVAEGEGDNNDGIKSGILDIRSSNPKSGSASVVGTYKVGEKYYTRVLVFAGKKKGTADITIKSMDGTGKSFKFRVVTTDDPADDTPES
ncbi:MAG: hypothetical protein K6E33_02235, partial [Lachnospiraceae bacterium]|nr:hypothetical protein [Lachnospiraceae bacterium]